jgi:hypothetical protein
MRNEQLFHHVEPELMDPIESFDFNSFLEKAHTLPRGEPLTYGATPLDRMTTLQQQLNLAVDLQQLTYRDIPDDVPMDIIDYVHTTFASRFHNRAEANEENYMTSLYTDDDCDAAMLPMFRRAELGQASPSELLVTRKVRGIRSVELACLTHPYGKRIDTLLPKMREVVKQHVELLGGSYYDEPETRYRVKEVVGYKPGKEQFDKGLLMTRKRTLGEMPDGTIIRERSSFVLRLDEYSPFSKAELGVFEGIDRSAPDWKNELVEAGKLNEISEILLDKDKFSLAIPISTTIYAYNTETAAMIEKRDAVELAKRRALFAQQHPILSAAMNMEQVSTNVSEDRSGILYVGPMDQSEDPFESL